jgi:hypothetical protein
MKILVVVAGISNQNHAMYVRDAVIGNTTFKRFIDSKYDKVVYLPYQDILDKHAIIAKTLLDPLRLKLYPKAQAEIITRFETIIKYLQSEGHTVDILAHSLGCWITAKLDVQVDRVIHMGSPIGWKFPLGRFIVRNDIAFTAWSKPKLKCNMFFNLYSSKDIVGNKPVLPANPKWGYDSKVHFELNSKTSHDADKYIEFLKDRRYVVW